MLLNAAQRLFAGCHVVLATDPEDKDISYVRVYGVPDTEVKSARRQLWNAIEELAGKIDVDSFVPSVVSASDTATFYPAFMPIPPIDSEEAIAASIFRTLHIKELAVPPKFPSLEPAAILHELPRDFLTVPGETDNGGFDNGRANRYAA